MATTQLASLSKLLKIPIDSHYDESYIIRLASMSLQELLDEPARLETKADSLEREIQTKAIEQNEVFEKAQRCFSEVVGKVERMQKSVASTHEYLPTVEYSCKSFTKEVESTYSRYTQSKKALKYHSQLLDLLEMPQLMDTCIRNNLHEEGLVLLRHASALFAEHFPGTSPSDVSQVVPSHNGSSVILSIFRDMLSVGEQQESLLLRELETDITIPRCIEIIHYLEENIALRFNASPKPRAAGDHIGDLLTAEQLTRLKREFLDARERFFARQTQLLSSFDSGEYLRGAIDIFKAKLTGVVAQFEASFGDSLNDEQLHRYVTSQLESFRGEASVRLGLVTSGAVLATLFRELVTLGDALALAHCGAETMLQEVMAEAVAALMDKYIS
ncbi:hypothetical protein WA588_003710 [Blastocystis sp. NMH]